MKKTVLLFLSIMLQIVIFAENRVASEIKEATVYLTGAKLQSVAKTQVSAGNSEIIFENLSPNIYAQSVQVKMDGKVKLLSAKFRTRFIEGERQDGKIKFLQDSIEILSKLERVTNDDIYSYIQEEKMLTDVYNKMLNSSSDWVKALTPIAINDFKQFPTEYASKLRKIKEAIRELEWKKQKIQKENTAIQTRIYNLAPRDAKTTGEIVLQVNSLSLQNVEITCIYLITNASWTPMYDISSDGTDKPVHLTYKGGIRQSSGFDWKNIQLKLSTSNPFTNNSRPILSPLYVDYYVAQAYNYEDRAKADNVNTYTLSNMAQVGAESREQKTADPAKIVTGGVPADFSIDEITEIQNSNQVFVELDVPNKHDIASTGEEQIIEVENYDIQAQYQYHTVPKLECAVFLLAKITNYGQYNLMPGTANIFYQNTLIGQSQIDPKTVSDTMLLSFGRDENISVKRTRAVDVTATKVIGTNKREILGFDIIVKNNRNIPINIEILDQIPISRNSEIEVTAEELAGAEYIKDYGKLLWRVAIPANQSKKIRFSYVIKYPKDKSINLNYDASDRNGKVYLNYAK